MKIKFAIFIWAICIVLVLFMFINFNKVDSISQSFDENKFYVTSLYQGLLPKIENEMIDTAKEKEVVSFYLLSDHERWLVESIVAGESGIEPYWGKVGVASCILNACLIEDKRPEEIQTMYGYAGWKSIEEYESECLVAYGNTNLSDEVREAVSQVFDRGEVLSTEILWFYAPKYSNGSFHQTQKFVIEIGGHRFFAPW